MNESIDNDVDDAAFEFKEFEAVSEGSDELSVVDEFDDINLPPIHV